MTQIPIIAIQRLQILRGVAEEIMAQQNGGANQKTAVQIATVQQLVHVAAVAVHLQGKPVHRPSLQLQLILDQVAEMEII